jgi:ABC-type multidrug transport system permease subunit
VSRGVVAANVVLIQAEPYLEVVVVVLLGVCSALLAFCKLLRRRGNNLWLAVLILSFVMCAYGLGLLSELAAEGA